MIGAITVLFWAMIALIGAISAYSFIISLGRGA